ncbi:MAG: hypothetical protein FWE83_10740 [Oscillospiraceae bacterium]|nr:hypothetical protein [Oscillospiraceae bacterium]
MIAKLAQRAGEASRMSLVVTVSCSLMLLMLPTFFWLLRQHPYEMYARFYDYHVTMSSFVISGDEVIFTDTAEGRSLTLTAPLEFFPESDFANENAGEIFDRLALLNNYYSSMLLPIMLLIFLISSVSLLSLSGMIAGMMGIGRIMTHALPISKRLRIFAVCFWLPALPSAVVGFILPVFHLLIFQLIVGFLAWRVQKVM